MNERQHVQALEAASKILTANHTCKDPQTGRATGWRLCRCELAKAIRAVEDAWESMTYDPEEDEE